MNYKIGKKKIGSCFIILILIFMLLPLNVYIANSQPIEETTRYIIIEIYLSSKETKTTEIIVIPNEEKEETFSGSGAGGLNPISPIGFKSTGEKNYLTQPTDYTSVGWTNQIDAYD